MKATIRLIPLAVFLGALGGVEVPLISIGPGHVREVLPLLEVRGHQTYDPQGRLFLTTVSIGRMTAIDAVAAWLDDDREVVPEGDVFGPGETVTEHGRESLSEMDESKIAATAFVLTELTDYPEEHGRGVLIQEVVAGSPADGRLHAGETIVSIDGRPVDTLDEVSRAIDLAGTRRPVRLEVAAEGDREDVSLTPVRPRGYSRPVIGVSLIPTFPFDVRINSGEDGGPSAGLMWAVGLADLLTPGNLLAGRTVAGTGAVDLDGTVYPIGSVDHKVRAAKAAGAEVFFLPRLNLAEARAAGTGLPLIPVDDVTDALRYLDRGAA